MAESHSLHTKGLRIKRFDLIYFMKRAIFVLIFLTIVVTLPPFYLQWAESQRLNQIQEVKQQARPVFGERLETVLSELKSSESPSVIILYTGGTKSHLEPCGCYQEQSGASYRSSETLCWNSRRAYIVEQIRQYGIPTLLVDAGNIFDGKEEIDAKRCQVNLKAMSAMGYDAVALSQTDISYGDAYLSQQRAIATFPFLTSTEKRNGCVSHNRSSSKTLDSIRLLLSLTSSKGNQ